MIRSILKRCLPVSFALLGVTAANAQEHSVARQWNEVFLEGIRNDYARPTVHARNLFHQSVLMYDAWAAYDPIAEPYFLGRTLGSYTCEFQGVPVPEDVQAAQEEAISFAIYRLMAHRFANSPQAGETFEFMNALMADLGYDLTNTSTNYLDGDPAHLGNYLAQEMINFGFVDGSNESEVYANQFYYPSNQPLVMDNPGNPTMVNPNRWQPLSLSVFIDQSGNQSNSTPAFLSPEWGEVIPFSLVPADLTVKQRDGFDWRIYHDPGTPPLLEEGLGEGLESAWKWGHILVAIWQSHHENDGVMWDISPASIGNNPPLPTSFDEYPNFYNLFEGGDQSQGYAVNPKTGLPYEPRIVPRADYARVLAEFWADGPDSETPPGHWFTIVNTVNDHPELEKRWAGQGELLSDLEWDVKCYFTLGGGMHDAAISAWSVKGYYDFSRPVSAIRFMAEKGQCSDINLPRYHPDGFPLIPGYIELVEPGDPLAGDNNEFVNEIKLYTWRGPDYIEDPEVDQAGVGWILAKNWWPYQRPSFVTPPFAGYVSGHSTYSRTAAEIMTLITGDPYFPGGMSSFDAPANEFLVFEEGPEYEVLLEWATYRDASDQCSLSRIWGGIHPPCDDIPGRLIGAQIGPEVFQYAETYMFIDPPKVVSITPNTNLVNDAFAGSDLVIDITFDRLMNPAATPTIGFPFDDVTDAGFGLVSAEWISGTQYRLTYTTTDINTRLDQVFVQVLGAVDTFGKTMNPHISADVLVIDTENPEIQSASPESLLVNDNAIADQLFNVVINFSEPMDTDMTPNVTFTDGDPLAATLTLNASLSGWISDSQYEVVYDAADSNEEIPAITLHISNTFDAAGNAQLPFTLSSMLEVDTKNPSVDSYIASSPVVNEDMAGSGMFTIHISFDEAMDFTATPVIQLVGSPNPAATLSLNNALSGWVSTTDYTAYYDVTDANQAAATINISSVQAKDLNGNTQVTYTVNDAFIVDTDNPTLVSGDINDTMVADVNVGQGTVVFSLEFSEPMEPTLVPQLQFTGNDPSQTLTFNAAESGWSEINIFEAVYDVTDADIELSGIGFILSDLTDINGNAQQPMQVDDEFSIDTRNPHLLIMTANDYELTSEDAGTEMFEIILVFDEVMNTNSNPVLLFPSENPLSSITANAGASGWINNTIYSAVYNVSAIENTLLNVDISVAAGLDQAGNLLVTSSFPDFFSIDINNSIEETDMTGLGLYPNPVLAGQEFTLSVDGNFELTQIEIVNVQGALVSLLTPQTNGLIKLQAPEVSGLYFVRIIGTQGNQVLRLQVVR